MKTWKWKILSSLPNNMRFSLLRRMLHLEYELPKELVLKVADTQEEIEQALTILHDAYVEQGLMDEALHRMRITKYHCLPSTTIMVAKLKDEVVGTISLIRDSSFKLPVDSLADLSALRDEGLVLLEVSGLAIKKSHRSQKGKLLLPLCKYLWDYARLYSKADALVIATVGMVKDFYQGILLFEPLSSQTNESYSFVKCDTAVAQVLRINTCAHRYYKQYAHLPKERNFYHYFFQQEFPQFQYPERIYHTVSDPVLTPEMMNFFFQEKSAVFQGLSELEKKALLKFYHQESASFFPEHKPLKHPRFQVSCPVKTVTAARVEEVSRNGLRSCSLNQSLDVGQVVDMKIELGPWRISKVRARVVWTKEDQKAGFQILSACSEWHSFIDYLEGKDQAVTAQSA